MKGSCNSLQGFLMLQKMSKCFLFSPCGIDVHIISGSWCLTFSITQKMMDEGPSHTIGSSTNLRLIEWEGVSQASLALAFRSIRVKLLPPWISLFEGTISQGSCGKVLFQSPAACEAGVVVGTWNFND